MVLSARQFPLTVDAVSPPPVSPHGCGLLHSELPGEPLAVHLEDDEVVAGLHGRSAASAAEATTPPPPAPAPPRPGPGRLEATARPEPTPPPPSAAATTGQGLGRLEATERLDQLLKRGIGTWPGPLGRRGATFTTLASRTAFGGRRCGGTPTPAPARSEERRV